MNSKFSFCSVWLAHSRPIAIFLEFTLHSLQTFIVSVCALTTSTGVLAGPREDLLARYLSAAQTAKPGFSAFSSGRGAALHTTKFSGGKPDTPSCSSCHSPDPRQSGRTPTGKTIEPLAVSLNPSRFSDPAKVEKWFARNCQEVIGRECTPIEKGDWLSQMMSR